MTDTYADLHIHTTASDGTQEIAQVVERAKDLGFSCIAITDHDTISAELTEATAKMNDLEVITGVEVKVDFEGVRGELLGYFVDPASPAMRSMFDSMSVARHERMEEMTALCGRHLGIQITIDDVRAVAAGSLGRPHLAQLLVEKGAATSLGNAFNRLIGRGGPCYAPLRRIDFKDAVEAVHGTGGVTSIPHPCFMQVADWEGFLAFARSEGVDGVEVFYPYHNAAGKLKASPQKVKSMAERHGFLLTGGSDDHGPGSVKETLGEIKVPYARVEAMKEACGI